jgi:hypothetical protein
MARLSWNREFYIPKGALKVAHKAVAAEVYLTDLISAKSGKFIAMGFFGKAQKPTFHYSFPTAEKRAAYVIKWFASCVESVERKAKRKAEEKAKLAQGHSLQVGHILVSSWGYEQTNVSFYQVVELVGKQSVKLRSVGKNNTDFGWAGHDTGHAIPAIDEFCGEAFIKRVKDNGVRIESFEYARLWEGKPVGWTAYA